LLLLPRQATENILSDSSLRKSKQHGWLVYLKEIMPKSKTTKKEAYEDLDYLKQIDRAPNDSVVAKIVADDIKIGEEKEQKVRDDTKNSLVDKGKFTYRNRLAAYAQAGLESITWPEGWVREAVATDGGDIRIWGKWFKSQEGILIVVKSPRGEVFIRGIKTTNDAELDVNAIDILIVQAENTLDSSRGVLLSDNVDTTSTLRKTKSGIILPN
jgi:hypothetical protein